VRPHLRRLTTAGAVLLIATSLIAFGVGRATRPSQAEMEASRSGSEVTAFKAAEHEAFLRAKERGYAAGLMNGRAAGRRAGEARGEAMLVATQFASAAHTHPHVPPAPSTDGAEEDCCPASSAGSARFAWQDESTDDGENSSPETLASVDADSWRGTSSDDRDSAGYPDSSSRQTDPDPTVTASAEPVTTAQRPRPSEAGWGQTSEAGGAAGNADYAEYADETHDADGTDDACEAEEATEVDEAGQDHGTDEVDEATEADEADEEGQDDATAEADEEGQDDDTAEAGEADQGYDEATEVNQDYDTAEANEAAHVFRRRLQQWEAADLVTVDDS